MYSHVFTGMKSFMVVLAVVIILNLTVLGVSGQVANASNGSSPANGSNGSLAANSSNSYVPADGEYGSKCDPTKTNAGDCDASLECLNSHCDCNPKKRLVWSPYRFACKLKTGQPIDANSACKDSGECTDFAVCVRQSSYVCLGGCYHRPYYHYPHYHRPVYIIHSGGGGSYAPAPVGPPGPPECHCKNGPGSIDGTCAASGALAGKSILPYSIIMLGIGLTVISGIILY